MFEDEHDVIVVGCGNAALCAALSAAEQGGNVLMLEAAPDTYKGGNSFFAGGLVRFPYGGIDDVMKVIPDLTPAELDMMVVEPYTSDDFFEDVVKLGDYENDPDLVGILVDNAWATIMWLRDHGVRFLVQFGRQGFKDDAGKFHFPGGVIAGAVGGGQGLVEQELEAAERLGIEIAYETMATGLLTEDDRVVGVRVRHKGHQHDLRSRAVVLASGGFEANPEMRARYLGPGWDRATIRGTPYNTGLGITMALAIGAAPYGNWSAAHAVAWDLNAPKLGDRKLTNLFSRHSYPYGLVVNAEGKRFIDEGYDVSARTYARYGGEILKQPGRKAFQIFDNKVMDLLREEYRVSKVTRVEAGDIRELAEKLGIPPQGLSDTIDEFNGAVLDGIPFDPSRKDGRATIGIDPVKSNWAQAIDAPQYVAFPVTCGITFTFGGLKISDQAQVIAFDGNPIPGLFAAGELVGGLYYGNYPSGSGLVSGATFGRIAGRSAVST